ncbi:MAG: hypothetical protein PHR66_12325 [Desulfuromonadaceae bacterium]|nr:hypothetical protein [Desulfuromonadaceae bacterium]
MNNKHLNMYEANIAPFPFWGKVTASKMGRDPLAVQNSSVVIYSDMISGITNVTGRIRYNGFYCWLFTFIAERLSLTDKSQIDNPKLQIEYLRRAELLLAFAMMENYPTAVGVNGSTYAQKHIHDEELDLAKGAEIKKKDDVYWQNSNGIFGQYYVGVLTQLRLIYMPDAKHLTYRVTDDGKSLGEIFRKSLGSNGENIFWDAISSGKITKDTLPMFKGLALHFVDDEMELQEYTKIFCSYDSKDVTGNEIYHRLNSMKLLLRYIEGEGAAVNRRDFVLSFLKHNFQHVLNEKLEVSNEELTWFLYELNELVHAAYEAFHFAVLYSTTEDPQPLDDVLERLESEYKENLKDEVSSTDIYELYGKLRGCYKDKSYGALTHEASRLFFALYNAVESYIPKLMDYARAENYDVYRAGFAPSLLLRFVGDKKPKCDWGFTEECIYSAINDHLRSSYSKSSIGLGIVHNYMVEDGLIWQLRRPDPIRTSPRLQNVLQYIEDMKWIDHVDDYYNITERGLNILKK